MNVRRDDERDITVLGGGIIGITTALYLELEGYSTILYTARIPFDDEPNPSFATPYAAASIQPASVTMEDLDQVFATSQEFFALLADSGSMGVRQQSHFIVYEDDQPDPMYADDVEEFHRITELDEYPHRPGARSVSGWRFLAYFAEMPTYITRCYSLYQALGGEIRKQTLSRSELSELPGTTLVNCTGLGAWELFEDERPYEIHVGHQVIARDHPLVRDSKGRICSYKYLPDPDVIGADLAGEVYSYPRMDALILGGSRISLDATSSDEWDGTIEGATRTIDGIQIPSRIIDTNKALLKEFADMELNATNVTARYGYRPVRDPDGAGVRIELEWLDDRPIIHNYGHGGAGVTLSWGSAARAAPLVRETCTPRPANIDTPRDLHVAKQLAAVIRS